MSDITADKWKPLNQNDTPSVGNWMRSSIARDRNLAYGLLDQEQFDSVRDVIILMYVTRHDGSELQDGAIAQAPNIGEDSNAVPSRRQQEERLLSAVGSAARIIAVLRSSNLVRHRLKHHDFSARPATDVVLVGRSSLPAMVSTASNDLVPVAPSPPSTAVAIIRPNLAVAAPESRLSAVTTTARRSSALVSRLSPKVMLKCMIGLCLFIQVFTYVSNVYVLSLEAHNSE
ncbi:hypothetical protein V8E36_009494 [Tilletia maclaganii]